MHDEASAEAAVLSWVLVGLAGLGLISAFARQALFADGSYQLLRVIQEDGFAWFHLSRRVSHILQQWPTVLALRAGVTDPYTLAVVYGLTLNLTPVLLTAACLLVLPEDDRDFLVFPVLSLVAGTLAGSFASISDAHIPTACFWPLLCLVLLARTRMQWVFLFLLSALSLLLQELYVLLAPILALAALLRARREPSAARRGCLAVLAAWFVVVALTQAIFIVVQPFSAENRESVVTTVIGLQWLVLGKTVNVPAALGVLLLLVGGAAWATSLAGGQVARRLADISVPTMAFAATLGIVLPVVAPDTVNVHSQFVGRYNGAFVTFVLGLVVLATLVRPASALEWRRSLPAAAIGLAAVGAVGWHLVVLHQWNAYLGDVEDLLARNRGYVAWLDATEQVGEDIRLRFTRFSWGWTNPSMSILLAPEGKVSSILGGPPGAWKPYDPQVASTLPLSPLLSYAPYVTALSKASVNRD